MEEKRKERGGCSVITIICICLMVLLPVLYVLSLGPAAWLYDHGYLQVEQGSAAWNFYTPIRWACQYQPIENALIWYQSFFR